MKRFFLTAAAVAMATGVAAAQPPNAADLKKLKAELDQMVAQSKIVGLSGAVMNAMVKGAPYTGVEVTENTQMLADGTRIHNESQTKVYRDSEGRIRRETPAQITIMDPVAGTTYILDPKNLTARKVSLSSTGTFVFKKSVRAAGGDSSVSSNVEVHNNNGVISVMIDGKPADPATIAKMKAAGELEVEPKMEPPDAQVTPLPRLRVMAGPANGDAVYIRKMERDPGQSESLGKQTLEGVPSEGTRVTSTLPTGGIGNDRPIQSISERWYSPELQTVMMSKHSDPRTGEEIFRLTNVTRGEPSPDLFQVPLSYRTVEKEKM